MLLCSCFAWAGAHSKLDYCTLTLNAPGFDEFCLLSLLPRIGKSEDSYRHIFIHCVQQTVTTALTLLHKSENVYADLPKKSSQFLGESQKSCHLADIKNLLPSKLVSEIIENFSQDHSTY